MKNLSMFLGIKELKKDDVSLMFERNGGYWKVYHLSDRAWIYAGVLYRYEREANKRLFERGLDLI